jgi:hypothetical protein
VGVQNNVRPITVEGERNTLQRRGMGNGAERARENHKGERGEEQKKHFGVPLSI